MIKVSKEKRQGYWKKGKRAEMLAGTYLQEKGYCLIASNVRLKTGEIDIIATKASILVMVEVKARPSLEEGLQAIGEHQRKRIINATSEWLAKEYENGQKEWQDFNIRYDIIVVVNGVDMPHHIENAYEVC